MSFNSQRHRPRSEPLPVDSELIQTFIQKVTNVSPRYRVVVDPSRMKQKNDLQAYIDGSCKRLTVFADAMSLLGYQSEVKEYHYRGSWYPNAVFWQGERSNGKTLELGAHFDHCAQRGHIDNATGLGGMLGVAAAFAGTEVGQKVRYRAFGMEEAGLIGSSAVARSLELVRGQCAALVNLDSIGYGKSIAFMSRTDLIPSDKEPPNTAR